MPVEWKRVIDRQFQDREQLCRMGYKYTAYTTSINIQALWQATRARRQFRMYEGKADFEQH